MADRNVKSSSLSGARAAAQNEYFSVTRVSSPLRRRDRDPETVRQSCRSRHRFPEPCGSHLCRQPPLTLLTAPFTFRAYFHSARWGIVRSKESEQLLSSVTAGGTLLSTGWAWLWRECGGRRCWVQLSFRGLHPPHTTHRRADLRGRAMPLDVYSLLVIGDGVHLGLGVSTIRVFGEGGSLRLGGLPSQRTGWLSWPRRPALPQTPTDTDPLAVND